MTSVRVLLDEHLGRVFERVLRERGYEVEQAKDRFGERTSDHELLRWCDESDTILISNYAKDFELLHHDPIMQGCSCSTTRACRTRIQKVWPVLSMQSSTSMGPMACGMSWSRSMSGTTGCTERA